MSFGFSVGDFIAVGGLAVTIANTLRGTRSEYQELVRELKKYAFHSWDSCTPDWHRSISKARTDFYVVYKEHFAK